MEDIREMKIEDIPECVSVIRSAFKTVADDLGFTPENAPRFTAFATDEKRLWYQYCEEHRPMYVFEKDGKIIGYYSLAILNDDEIELNNLAVLPDQRHNGIGKKLLEDCFSRAQKRGAINVKIGIVEENKILRKWYESFGFVHTDSVKYDFFPFTCGYMEKEV
ncbi:MAG: GNAT family N-acetyltransferase [Clostridiales bacterium]|nr:GNAT family N-acetyltransferase [Clostridiales bacterium]